MIMTIVQRGIGFVRGMWFCRLLDDVDLGLWAMAFGFITLVTPMMLFGIPGSLPRFVEQYVRQNRLIGFLKRVLGLTAILSLLGVSTMLIVPQVYGQVVFGDSQSSQLVIALAISVASIILFNVTNELLAGLRLVRVGSTNQFVHSVSFTILGALWLANGGKVPGLLIMFAISSLIGVLPGWWALGRAAFVDASSHKESVTTFPSRPMWSRLLPYAAALWAMNLLSNAFELSDRYMLLHFSSSDSETGQRFLGQYHSSLIIPYLFISLANMASSVLTPYLVVDWEKGNKPRVSEQLERFLIGMCTCFTAAAAIALIASPIVFNRFLEGRYSDGLGVMPLCFVFCVWFALSTFAQIYLWVAERGKLVPIVMAAGLATNISANAILVPRIGLDGAVWGTLFSHFVVLLGTWWAIGRSGFRLDAVIIWLTILPATLLAGPTAALLAIAVSFLASPKLRQFSTGTLTAAGCQFRAFAR